MAYPHNDTMQESNVVPNVRVDFAAGFLPVKLLVEVLNFSLVNDAAGKVTSALAMELDKRLKKSLLGDENYQLGDATKRTIADAVKNYTGKGWTLVMNLFPRCLLSKLVPSPHSSNYFCQSLMSLATLQRGLYLVLQTEPKPQRTAR